MKKIFDETPQDLAQSKERYFYINMYISCRSIFFFCMLSICSFSYALISYTTEFAGLKDKKTLSEMKAISNLVLLRKKAPRSISGLKFRAENDVPQFIEILHNHGYYEATIHIEMEENLNNITVHVEITPGERYCLSSYEIFDTKTKKPLQTTKKITPENLKLQIGGFSEAQKIIDARLILLSHLAEEGYPLAHIENQEVIVNTEKKQVYVKIYLETGPLCYFGDTQITGLKATKEKFIQKKVLWKKGEVYSSQKVNETQIRLIGSNIFSSVMITHAGKVDDKNQLAINIAIKEAKFKNVSLGVSYATIDGAGVDFTWVHRNLRGMGEVFSIEGDISQKSHTGKATYLFPDIFTLDQDLAFQLQAYRDNIHVYEAYTYSFLTRLDHRLNQYLSFSVGMQEEYIHVMDSINNGKYWLIDWPMFLKLTTTTHILNPSEGITVIYQPIPYYNFSPSDFFFFKQKLTTNVYIPIIPNQRLIFAWRFQVGSIIGAEVNQIPMTKLFFGGSDDDLRGYRYHTVSPKNRDGKVTGGRSAIYISFEPRIRLTDKIGVVPFTDWGTVSWDVYPNFCKKWYKSVGIGLRYYTFFGPLRLDVGFPLDRRSFDPRYRIYISIGQTF